MTRVIYADNNGLAHLPGEAKVDGKTDIGLPGSGAGIDVGEGGSYDKDSTGAVIVRAFSYDASEPGGSRFTELDIDAQNTWLAAAGDRVYVGSPYKFWAVRFEVGVAKTAETLEAYYWSGAALTQMSYMGMLKESVVSIGTAILEQTTEKEYLVYDKEIDSNWDQADDVLDTIPNTGSNLYWVCLQVPAGGLATPPRTDEIRVRGSDSDIKSSTSQTVYWGKARVEEHELLPIDVFRAPGGTPLAAVAITATQDQQFYQLRTGQNDAVSHSFILPHGIDTSCKLRMSIHYAADQPINTADIRLDVKNIVNGMAIGGGEASDYNQTTNINVVAGDTVYLDEDLTASGLIDISSLSEDDILMIELIRTDDNGGNFYPIEFILHYVIWTPGQPV